MRFVYSALVLREIFIALKNSLARLKPVVFVFKYCLHIESNERKNA